jgi:hypothetical protein
MITRRLRRLDRLRSIGALGIPVAMCLTLTAGCGSSADERQDVLGAARFRALTAELAGAGPQGQVTAAQSSAAAKRQAGISTRYASKVAAGDCQTRLQRLSTAYGAFERAAARSAAGDANDAAYGAAAGGVSTALTIAEKACA